MAETLTSKEAVEQLADLIADDLVTTLGDPEAKSPFLPIIIGLLPVLADLLANNCAPSDSAGLRKVVSQRGLRGRLFRWQYRNALKRVVANDADYAEWGSQLGDSVLEIIMDENNSTLVDAALVSKPVPIWGAFGSALLVLGLVFGACSGEALGQFSYNAAGQLVDDDGAVVVSVGNAPYMTASVRPFRTVYRYSTLPAVRYYRASPMIYQRPYGMYRTPVRTTINAATYPIRNVFQSCPNGLCSQ